MRGTAILFAWAIFSASWLIFAVQPMVAKHILPWFGGVPSVWMLCLAFYQLALFVGYLYAHWLATKVARPRQAWIHGALACCALLTLPVLPAATWKPTGERDVSLQIAFMLAANVGPAFVLLASTGPLVQAWAARAFPGRSPYTLYAVSNLGSLLALLTYPTLVEPWLSVSVQSQLFSVSFGVCALAVVGCAFFAARHASDGRGRATHSSNPSAPAARAQIALWILLPACAVVMLMGVTNQLCLDVASFPFLWILPLSIYLITLILCFASEHLYRRGVSLTLAAIFVAALVGPKAWAFGSEAGIPLGPSIVSQVALHAAALFFGCTVAHGELYRSRPDANELTRFYLCVAGGGALGGVFVGILAPHIFSDYYELPLGAALCWLLAVASAWREIEQRGASSRVRRGAAACALGAGVALLAISLSGDSGQRRATRLVHRGFFGILRVIEGGHAAGDPWRMLRSGTTNHGLQLLGGDAAREPTSYYGVSTGIGLLLADRMTDPAPMDLGVIGLGVGTLAAYGRTGDRVSFYEIDPEVVRIARDSGLFSYLRDAAAETTIVVGDARLSLEAELAARGGRAFDVLVVDAFTSDSVPVHLLTREAFALYRRHLRPNGALAIHVSNRHLNLAPLVFRLGEDSGLHAVAIDNSEVPDRRSGAAQWIVLSPRRETVTAFAHFADRHADDGAGIRRLVIGRPPAARVAASPLWTDDYSNVLGLLRLTREADATRARPDS